MDAPHADVTVFFSPFPEGSSHSHALLSQAAQCYSGLRPGQLGELEANPWGKPFFSLQPGLHFSITHSGDWWLCAFSGSPIGLDLQIHRSHAAPEALSRRFFHPREDAFLSQENHRRFFDLWCAKESWVKYTGRGFWDSPESFSVVSARGDFPAMDGAQMRLLPFTEGYSLCLCSQSIGEVRFASLSRQS